MGLTKKAFPGSKSHSLVVIPAEAGIQSKGVGELIRVGIPGSYSIHGFYQMNCVGRASPTTP